ncbi:ATP-binding cassette domain-containing protein [Sedimentitalea sp.]|uniref:ATP-binding cassette domain-containing protein n=1 Tax=Sedimentitalea sp. TaxID=2048915 RepID=UPI003299234B
MTAPLLEAKSLTRRYHLPRNSLLRPPPVLTAVSNISFTIQTGETLGIVGESGSGKSTLARIVMAFETPDAGEVLFRGRNLHTLRAHELRKLRQQFQMVFQDPFGSLDPRRKVGWSISEPLRVVGVDVAAGLRVREVLEQVGLHPLDADKYPHEFSGGQRQRIAIARAIVTRPALLVADEAVSALDVSVQAQILNLLMDLQDNLGLGILFISHDLAVVSQVCDNLLVMQHGELLEAGPVARILHNPAHLYTQTLLQAAGMTS